jgi:hypothetical protein
LLFFRFLELKESFEKVKVENQAIFDRQAAHIEAVNTRQDQHKQEAESGLQALNRLLEATGEELSQKMSSMEAGITVRIEANQTEAAKGRAKLGEDIVEVQGRLEDHEAKHEKAEAALRLHDKAIDEVRQEMIAIFWYTVLFF